MCYLFVVVTCMATVLAGVAPMPSDDGEDLFDPYSLREFTMPKSCKNEGREFCFENDDYPTAIVEDLLKDMNDLEVAHNDDVGELSGSYSSRQGVTDEPDCRTDSTDKPIYYIVDEAGRDRVVVQMEGKFQQRYSILWCEKEGRRSKTSHFLESTLTNYKMTCENKYMNYDFLVLSVKPDITGRWQMERAKTKTGIPVCCACRYEKTD
ncbi:uncharacterized protein LOC142973854 [Anticarsia gemmatalis]|uniref:uncharacterized protein LOC142973854 n=1 Tax=Anticarsia gemmatalis TaxID=129554 RepID=UPI003F76D33C